MYARLAVSPGGEYVYVATYHDRNFQAEVSVIDTDTLGLAAIIPITLPYQFLEFKGMDIHPTASELYMIYKAGSTGLNDFYVIDTMSNTIVDSLKIGVEGDIYGDLLIIRP
ncbi:MAG: hypothetical protein ACOX3E_05205 [Desulfomonilia bacterium]